MCYARGQWSVGQPKLFNHRYQSNTIPSSGADLCWALGGMICNFTPILPYFQHWGDEPRPRFCSGVEIKWRPKEKCKQNTFSPRIQPKTKKEKVFCKNRTLFPPNLRSAVYPFKLLGGMQNRTILKHLGGYSQIIGGTYPPRVLAPLISSTNSWKETTNTA